MKRKLLILSMIVLMGLSGCVPRVRKVLVTNYPTEYLVNTLAGNRVQVNRLDTGSSIQSAGLVSNYKTLIKEADVIFYINELQPYWELVKDDLTQADLKMIDLAEFTSLYPFKRYTTIHAGQEQAVVEGDYYKGIGSTDLDMYLQDPVLWVDPKTMSSMASTIKDWLVASYPDDKQIFEANFEALKIDLVRLQADFSLLKESDTDISLVSMTPSFGNWQKSFGMDIYPVILSKYGVLPNERELDIIRERIINDGATHIIYEEGMDEATEKLYNQLKTELDLTEIKLSTLYNLSASDAEMKVNYITKMYQNLETLEALSK